MTLSRWLVKNGSGGTTKAPARCRVLTKANSSSSAPLTVTTNNSRATARAASCISSSLISVFALFGFMSKPIVAAVGTNSTNSCSCLGTSEDDKRATPVMFAPGLLRFETRPSFTGSVPDIKTVGILAGAALAATAAGSAQVAIAATSGRRTRSAASPGSRSKWPSAQRYSITTFCPSA